MITGVITTFERPALCSRLIASARQHQPDLRLLVVDDSEMPGDWPEADRVVHLPFDSGLSAKRNAGVAAVGSGWVVVLDDDTVFTASSSIARLVELAEECGLDIVAGQLIEHGVPLDYYGWFEQSGSHVTVRRGWVQDGSVRRCHLVPNFFVARAETLAAHPWDETLKLGEHTVFFWSVVDRLKVGWTDEVQMEHRQDHPGQYRGFRLRAWDFKQDWLNRHGLTWTDMNEHTMGPSGG